MKKVIFLSILMLLVGTTAVMAQRNGGRGNRAGTPTTARNPNTVGVRNNRTHSARRSPGQENAARPDIQRRKPKKISKLLRGLNLSDRQKRKTRQILKEAKANGTSKNEVLREINSILNPRQSKKFKKKIKRIYRNKNGDDTSPPVLEGSTDQPGG